MCSVHSDNQDKQVKDETINWWTEITAMCKQKPAVNNGGQDVSSSNMAIGLVNFSNEEFSLSKPHHRTEIIAILIFIMILAFGLYKLRQRCMKKRNNQQANITPHAPLPYSPPNYARDVPYDPAYYPAQPAQATLAQPMPYDIVATLGRKNSNDSI